ncbi:MAG: YggS family pyridoxal phosphate-dependent enzyme [Christensenellales bacterium]
MDSMKRNVFEIFEKIEKIADPESVEVIAATKTQPLEVVLRAIEGTPIKTAGENRVQELLSKYDERLTWDFIGRLQTNKVKYLIDKVRLIHSVDRPKLLQTIDQEARKKGKLQDILIQINAGGEESKGGILFEEAFEFASLAKSFENIRVRGVMAVTPYDIERSELIKLFDKAKKVFDRLKGDNNDIRHLSMGMSDDYLLAIEHGANLVRLGRAIFGERK